MAVDPTMPDQMKHHYGWYGCSNGPKCTFISHGEDITLLEVVACSVREREFVYGIYRKWSVVLLNIQIFDTIAPLCRRISEDRDRMPSLFECSSEVFGV
jgi:hypothetical protein